MRVAAPLTAFLLVAGCSSTPAPPAPATFQTAPSAAPTIAPTPPPSPQTELVPTIDYPDAPGAATAAPAASGGGSTGGGGPGAPGGDSASATGSPAPTSAPTEAPGADAPAAMTLQLDHMPLTLQGFSARVSSTDSQVVLYQAGPNEDALTDAAPGCLRVGFRFAATHTAGKPNAIEAATVRYTQLVNGGRASWLANYKPGDASATLMLDATVSEGRLSFNLKGTLASDGGSSFFGGFGGFGGPTSSTASAMFIDWRVTSAGLPTPSTASPSPSPTPFSYF